MKNLITFLFIIFAIPEAYSQEYGTVSGKIISDDGALPGATVHISGSEIGAIADAAGNFKLEKIAPGTILLEFRSMGFKPRSKRIKVVAGENQLLEIILKENSLGLNNIVVTGTMKSSFVKASPVKVEVVTSTYLNKFVPAAASSVVEGIKLVNGFRK